MRALLPVPVTLEASPVGAKGGITTDTGRIMSISSWLRMWQWKVYSQPKLTSWLTIGLVGLPCGSTLLNMAVEPSGIIGLSGRMALGNSQGTSGMIGLTATMVSSSGATRTVSFQPNSVWSGGMMMLSQVTRLINCTSYRCQWMGCVSTPLWVMRQICVPSELVAMEAILISLTGRPVNAS